MPRGKFRFAFENIRKTLLMGQLLLLVFLSVGLAVSGSGGVERVEAASALSTASIEFNGQQFSNPDPMGYLVEADLKGTVFSAGSFKPTDPTKPNGWITDGWICDNDSNFNGTGINAAADKLYAYQDAQFSDLNTNMKDLLANLAKLKAPKKELGTNKFWTKQTDGTYILSTSETLGQTTTGLGSGASVGDVNNYNGGISIYQNIINARSKININIGKIYNVFKIQEAASKSPKKCIAGILGGNPDHTANTLDMSAIGVSEYKVVFPSVASITSTFVNQNETPGLVYDDSNRPRKLSDFLNFYVKYNSGGSMTSTIDAVATKQGITATTGNPLSAVQQAAGVGAKQEVPLCGPESYRNSVMHTFIVTFCSVAVTLNDLAATTLQSSVNFLLYNSDVSTGSGVSANPPTITTGFSRLFTNTSSVSNGAQTHIQEIIIDTSKSGAATVVVGAYQLVLNMIGALTIVWFFIIGLANILQIQMNSYAIKKIIPGLIIGYLLAQGSMFIVRAGLEVSSQAASLFTTSSKVQNSNPNQALGNTFGKAGQITPGITDCSGNKVFVSYTASGGCTATNHPVLAGGANLGATILGYKATWDVDYDGIFQLCIINILVFVAAIMVFCLGFLYAIRVFIFYFLIPLAPLAFFSLMIQPMKAIWSRWWKTFSGWLFMPIVSSFWLWLFFVWVEASKSAGWAFMLGYTFGLICLYFAMTTPFKMAGEAKMVLDKWAGLGKKAAAPLAGMATTVGIMAADNIGVGSAYRGGKKFIEGFEKSFKERKERFSSGPTNQGAVANYLGKVKQKKEKDLGEAKQKETEALDAYKAARDKREEFVKHEMEIHGVSRADVVKTDEYKKHNVEIREAVGGIREARAQVTQAESAAQGNWAYRASNKVFGGMGNKWDVLMHSGDSWIDHRKSYYSTQDEKHKAEGEKAFLDGGWMKRDAMQMVAATESMKESTSMLNDVTKSRIKAEKATIDAISQMNLDLRRDKIKADHDVADKESKKDIAFYKSLEGDDETLKALAMTPLLGEAVEKAKTKTTHGYLTHRARDFGTYDEINSMIGENNFTGVAAAFDKLSPQSKIKEQYNQILAGPGTELDKMADIKKLMAEDQGPAVIRQMVAYGKKIGDDAENAIDDGSVGEKLFKDKSSLLNALNGNVGYSGKDPNITEETIVGMMGLYKGIASSKIAGADIDPILDKFEKLAFDPSIDPSLVPPGAEQDKRQKKQDMIYEFTAGLEKVRYSTSSNHASLVRALFGSEAAHMLGFGKLSSGASYVHSTKRKKA